LALLPRWGGVAGVGRGFFSFRKNKDGGGKWGLIEIRDPLCAGQKRNCFVFQWVRLNSVQFCTKCNNWVITDFSY